MKRILFLIVFVLALALSAFAQDERPKYVGGGVELTMNGMTTTTTSIAGFNALSQTTKQKSTTAFGGFVEGNLPMFSIFEANVQMGLKNRDPFGQKNSTLVLEPGVNMFIPVYESKDKKIELKFGGVAGMQRVGLGNDATVYDFTLGDYRQVDSFMAINPGFVAGIRFNNKYTADLTTFFDDMNNSSGANSGRFEQSNRRVRAGVQGLHGVTDHFGFMWRANYEHTFGTQDQVFSGFIQRNVAPQNSLTFRVGMFVK